MLFPFRDHPRICGEKENVGMYFKVKEGSPPHMRGKAATGQSWEQAYRITPAYAGKRNPRCSKRNTGGDHPRICGEKCNESAPLVSMVGSPPHMRGKGKKDRDYRQRPGITPAYAGKSHFAGCPAFCRKDHPRICGEKAVSATGGGNDEGSPPHMRGKVPLRLWHSARRGITPAYAGKR